jgi:hypothetical protein
MTQLARVVAEDLSLIVDGGRASLLVTRGEAHPAQPDFLDIEFDVSQLEVLKRQIEKTMAVLERREKFLA